MIRYISRKYVTCFIIFFMAITLFIATQVSAQIIPPIYGPFMFYNPFLTDYNPYFAPVVPPLFPIAPLLYPPVPTFNPYLATLPTTLSRNAAATIILLPPAPVTTAAAPLGTFALTPSTLLFLILAIYTE